MLVLSRTEGEEIRIGDDIIISVLEVKRNHIKIGINAPREVSILRAELQRKESDTPEPESGQS